MLARLLALGLSFALTTTGCGVADRFAPDSDQPDAGPGGGGPGERQGLRAEVSSGLSFIGASIQGGPVAQEEIYRQIAARDFNLVVGSNAFKWRQIQPAPGNFSFDGADALVDFADANQQVARGHSVIWSGSVPDYVYELSPDEFRDAMVQHITEVVGRYRGQVAHWDLVTQAFRGPALKEDVFLEKLGPGYIELAFEAARAADPDALLFYNDVSITDLSVKSDAVYEHIGGLLQRGVPIDGLGIQAHIDAYQVLSGFLDEPSIRENIRRFAELGLRVYFTEVIVTIGDLLISNQERLDAQREIYRILADVCRTEPGCEGMITWGFTDKHATWIYDHFGPDAPLLYDDEYRQKPAYFGVLDGMTGVAGEPLPALDTDCTTYQTALFCDPFESSRAGNLAPFVDEGASLGSAGLAYRGDGALIATIPGGGTKAYGIRRVLPKLTSGDLYARAFVYLPSGAPVEGFNLFGASEATPPHEGVVASLASEGRLQISVNTDDQPPTPVDYAIPRDEWVCLVLHVEIAEEGGSATLSANDTERVNVTDVDTLPAGGYVSAQAGISYSRPAQAPIAIRFDEFAISDAPLTCANTPGWE